jgi:DNA-binding response OmpR family regulator
MTVRAEPIRVVVVEDDLDLQTFLRSALEAEGMDVQTSGDGAGALALADPAGADIMLLDLDLPDADGLDVLTTIRERGNLPVIVLTGRRQEHDRVAGLERGADDYVVKPFSPRELVLRIQTVLRRATPTHEAGPGVEVRADGVLRFDDLVLDLVSRSVEARGETVALTKREFDLLAFFAANPRRVFSRQELLTQVWGSSEEWQVPATVTEHVRRIRLKIEADPSEPQFLHNVRGVGYRFL